MPYLFPLPNRRGSPALRAWARSWRRREVSGRAVVDTFTIPLQPFDAYYAARVPYTLAVVELVEQKRLKLLTNIVDIDPDDVAVGMPGPGGIQRGGGRCLPSRSSRPSQSDDRHCPASVPAFTEHLDLFRQRFHNQPRLDPPSSPSATMHSTVESVRRAIECRHVGTRSLACARERGRAAAPMGISSCHRIAASLKPFICRRCHRSSSINGPEPQEE